MGEKPPMIVVAKVCSHQQLSAIANSGKLCSSSPQSAAFPAGSFSMAKALVSKPGTQIIMTKYFVAGSLFVACLCVSTELEVKIRCWVLLEIHLTLGICVCCRFLHKQLVAVYLHTLSLLVLGNASFKTVILHWHHGLLAVVSHSMTQ